MASDTTQTEVGTSAAPTTVESFELTVQQRGAAPRTWRSTGDGCSIGSHASNELVIDAPQVSRFHCELRKLPRGLLLKDLGSSNGSFLDGVNVVEAWVQPGSRLTLGTVTVEVRLNGIENTIPTSQSESFGALVGTSRPMRALFAQLERAAPSNITVLLEGETGSGKEEAAAALHAASPRANAPFVVIDCSMLPAALLELQPKLLRVLEAKEFRRLGSNTVNTSDVRVIAATNRDLRREINEARFRADLYFRLAVLRVTLPPLRAHPEDIPLLARKILAGLGARPKELEAICTPALMAALRSASWPGNVRELRNHLEKCLLFSTGLPPEEEQAAPLAAPLVDITKSLAVERRRHTEVFEREYLRALLGAHNGQVSAAAAAAGVDRAYVYRLIKRLGLNAKD